MTLSFTGRIGEAAPAGDLGLLHKAHFQRVRGLCFHLLRDRALAEDAAGEVFLRLRQGLATHDNSVPMERWVLRIAANHCIDVLRRRKLERRWMVEAGPFEPPSREASPLTILLVRERREAVERAIEDLEDAYRMPLVLRYDAGLSYDEIAGQLGLEKTQVAGRIFRAKQMLRAALKEIL